MNFSELVKTRRSIRKYLDREIPEKEVSALLESAMYAPSAVNKQPWHFIVVSDKEQLSKMAEIHPNGKMVASAALAIVVCGDSHAAHGGIYWPVDCAAATQNILLSAHARGIGAVWLGIHPRREREEAFRKLFFLPDHIYAFSAISLGYPDEEKEQPDRYDSSKIHFNRW